MEIPRPEYPRPQFCRKDWLCLNGEWEFEIDPGDSGLERGLLQRTLKDLIQVPFCPESSLSGIGNTDFLNAVWYRREVTIPVEWQDKEVLLHFQAVDYDTTVWVNGQEVTRHRGGFTPFQCSLRGIARPGEQVSITVRARDDHRQPKPCGKQVREFANHGCEYTRTTGIWQTVWMEPVHPVHFLRPRITPLVGRGAFQVELPVAFPVGKPIEGFLPGGRVRVVVQDREGEVVQAVATLGLDKTVVMELLIPPDRRTLWEPGNPYLYGFVFQLLSPQGEVLDEATGYAGLRGISVDGKKVLLNGKPLFQRLVLDQGYYPDGIMTAPSDEALVSDIEISLAAGFNGARLHQKVFEERFLYHADRLGYLVWGEFADWGVRGFGPAHDHQRHTATFITQWLEVLERDYSHPCIVGWCPLNETWQILGDQITALDEATWGMYLATRQVDSSRLVLDTSGYSHRVPGSDVYDCHDYEQDVTAFAAHHAGCRAGQPFINHGGDEQSRRFSVPYNGQPFFVSEFGGIWWNPKVLQGEDSWGYGERVRDIEAWYARFDGLCSVLLDDLSMFGYCYTQLTDVFQEQNGIFYFDRQIKFDLDRLRQIQGRPAAVEAA